MRFLACHRPWVSSALSLFIVEWASRRIVHFGETRSPTDEWVAQQLREATPFGQTPRFLIRDRDSKYGEAFTRVAVDTSIEVLKTPYRVLFASRDPGIRGIL